MKFKQLHCIYDNKSKSKLLILHLCIDAFSRTIEKVSPSKKSHKKKKERPIRPGYIYRHWNEIHCDTLKTLFDRWTAFDSVLQAVFFLSSVSDFELTSFHRAPALLDTYTLGLLAKFLPTDPAIRGQKGILHTHIRGVFPEYFSDHCLNFHIWKMCNPRTQTIAFCIFSCMCPLSKESICQCKQCVFS